MPKLNARQRVLTYLEGHRGASAAEVARALKVTPANVRHHLGLLVSDGLVQVLGLRSGAGKGRPVQSFGLSDSGMGNHLAGLAAAALRLWLAAGAGDERTLAQELCAALPPAGQGGITRRLALVVEHLRPLGYAPRWEARAEGPRVIFEHCPYAAVLAEHPFLCRVDEALLENRLGLKVSLLASLERNERGAPVCVFGVGEEHFR